MVFSVESIVLLLVVFSVAITLLIARIIVLIKQYKKRILLEKIKDYVDSYNDDISLYYKIETIIEEEY